MKLFGQKVAGPNVEFVVIPRQHGDVVFTAQAILDDDMFETLCPRPKPPKVMRVGSTEWSEDLTDTAWKASIDRWAGQRSAWIVIESLKATPKEILEWEKVKADDPNTWTLWQEEFKEAFFTYAEIMSIMNVCWSVNGLNQDKLDEARNRFLAGQQRPYKIQSLPKVEQPNMPSGEPVNDSTCSLPV